MSREAMTADEIRHIKDYAAGKRHDLPNRFRSIWTAVQAVCDEALRAALAETPQPVAWMNPAANVFAQHKEGADNFGCTVPLYTQPRTLTDKEILDAWDSVRSGQNGWIIPFARAVLRKAGVE